jgi:curved DNA-binding protein CbpA
MPRIHTHYDNLKVPRTATAQMIRAAYRKRAQRFHPDKNPGNADAARVMALINASYDVLSDPAKRKAHDEWVAQQEAQGLGAAAQPGAAFSPAPPHPSGVVLDRRALWLGAIAGTALLGALSYFLAASFQTRKTRPRPKPSYAAAPTRQPSLTRFAPNGQEWPAQAAELAGYPVLNTRGTLFIKLDNSNNDSDVFVKLVSRDATTPYAARHVFIPAFGDFTMTDLTPGVYDIRYRDLSTNAAAWTFRFHLTDGASHSSLHLPSGSAMRSFTQMLTPVRPGEKYIKPISALAFDSPELAETPS